MINKRAVILLALLLTGGFVYCQQEANAQNTKTLKGVVSNMDAVGNIINIQTDSTGTDAGQTNNGQSDNRQISFYISDQTRMVRDTHDIGLLDIKQGDPVTIQYDSSSPGKNTVISLVDNKPSMTADP